MAVRIRMTRRTGQALGWCSRVSLALIDCLIREFEIEFHRFEGQVIQFF